MKLMGQETTMALVALLIIRISWRARTAPAS